MRMALTALAAVFLFGLLAGLLFRGAGERPPHAPPVLVGAIVVAFAAGLGLAGFQFRRYREREREAARRRRVYLADIAHEFRTPLAVIRGQAEALADGLYPADAEHVAPIVNSVRALERLVDDLRTLNQTDAGALELRREPVDLRGLAAEVAAGLYSDADHAGVEIQVAVPAGLPPADADPARVRSVLVNLLTNALRHTPPGGRITVTGQRRGRDLEVAVEDTGEGIDPELRPSVFERFVKDDRSPGSGLGLAIVRDLVTAHGGTVTAEPRPGGGTTVRFTLPPA